MIWTLPNILTLSRIAWLPVMFLLFALESWWGPGPAWICFWIYVIAAITDFLDGFLARKLNKISEFGTFLDPISDKIFVASLLVLLVGFGRLPGIWMLPVLIILAREFLVSGMREFLGPRNIKLPVTKLAKWKTTVQMLSLGFLILGPYVPFTLILGRILLAGAAVITVMTGWEYLKTGINHMNSPQ